MFLGILSALIGLLVEIRYIFSILHGKTKPNFSGWFIIVLGMSIVFSTEYLLGASYSLFLIGTLIVLHSITAILCFWYGYVRFTKFESLLVTLSVIGVILWFHTENPWYALLLNVGVDALGMAAISMKLFLHPQTEDATVWAISVVMYLVNIASISHFTPQEYLFPLSNVFWCSVILLLSLRKKERHLLMKSSV